MAAFWAKESSSSSSSSFSIVPQHKYDVFLSFSGVDTRKNFTGHLLDALERHGFHTFRDDMKLKRGEDIESELLEAIEKSTISIIVFSKNYAASKWCLNELVKIMKCRKTFQQIVLPIFYDVVPSDVWAQTGSLAEAFSKHEGHFKEGSDDKVEKWRKALRMTASLSGWDLKNVDNGDEAKLIHKIIEEVGNIIDLKHLSVADYPVGLKCRVQELRTLLRMDSNDNDVCIVAIWGIGGLGKTTIAKKLYKLIRYKFDGSSFLADVRETWKKPNGLFDLQKQLLSDLFKYEIHHIGNIHQGKEVIIRRALRRKVLLVLDDVDDIKQLKELAIDRDNFGSGSRIIITTRDLSSLNFEVDEIYTPKELDKDKSLQLFSWHAFKEDHPIENYMELSIQVVDYARGLPLALEILGSFLSRIRSIPEWESAIKKLKKIPHDGIQEKLKISYDSLSHEVKELFLDIACFFVGMDRNFIIKMLKGCKLFIEIELRILFDRCLIKYGPSNKLEMHDMLRDMGREIIKQESNEEPGMRSRLWYHEDALEVLRYATGTEAVKGFFLNFPKSKEVQMSAKAFERMNKMWLLHLNYVHLRSSFEHIFKKLLWLSWKCCPLKWLPSKLYVDNLVTLDLRYSRLTQVWKGTKNLDNLKFLYLSHCHYLTKTPDFFGLNSLEELVIDNCISLVEIDESIGCLNKLLVLDMANCKKLEQFPLSILMLKSLEYLDLSGCSKLGELVGFNGSLSKSLYTIFSYWALPRKNVDSIGMSLQGSSCLKTLKMASCNLLLLTREIGSLISLEDLDVSYNNLYGLPNSICTNLTCLQKLDMAYNNVSHLPSEIGSLISLKHLDLRGNNLCTLPDSICNLTCLEELVLSGCNVSYLPSEIGRLVSLKHLHLDGNNLCTLPESIINLACLESLNMEGCNVSHLPSEINRLISLTRLDLRGNNFCTLPESICNLTYLQNLYLSGCNVPHLPNEIGSLISLTYLDLAGNNLCTLPDSICNLACLKDLVISGCNVSYLPSNIGRLISLKHLHLDGNNLSTLPDSICNLTCLEELFISGCNVSELPSEFGRLISLMKLRLSGNNLCTLPDSICNLPRLRWLYMRDCNLLHLPSEIWRLNSLERWDLSGNNLRTLPDGICKLTKLAYLYLEDCARLQSIPKLPMSLSTVYASGCVSLENIELKSLFGSIGTFMDFYGCYKLAENNFANNFIKAIIQDFPAVGSSSCGTDTQIYLCGGEVPRWLEYQSTGSYLSFKVPPFINQKILGLFVCVVCIGSKEKCSNGFFSCDIRKNKVRITELPCYYPASCEISGEDQMWLRFLPQSQFEDGDEVEISLETNMPIQFKKCAANFVCEVDENIIETNDEAFTQYTASSYQSVIFEEEEEEKEVGSTNWVRFCCCLPWCSLL